MRYVIQLRSIPTFRGTKNIFFFSTKFKPSRFIKYLQKKSIKNLPGCGKHGIWCKARGLSGKHRV